MVSAEEEVFTTWTEDLGDAVTVICLCGELDASSVPTFLHDTRAQVTSNRNIIFDTHLLSYIDSTGLGAILSIKQALQRSGRGLCLVGAHGLLSKILHITRADSEFRCYDNVEEAMAELQSPGW